MGTSTAAQFVDLSRRAAGDALRLYFQPLTLLASVRWSSGKRAPSTPSQRDTRVSFSPDALGYQFNSWLLTALWFPSIGGRAALERIVHVVFYRAEERARLRGEAMYAQGKGAQELLKALDTMQAVEQSRLKFISEKVAMMRDLGMSEETIQSMARRDLDRLERLAQALDVLQRHQEERADRQT